MSVVLLGAADSVSADFPESSGYSAMPAEEQVIAHQHYAVTALREFLHLREADFQREVTDVITVEANMLAMANDYPSYGHAVKTATRLALTGKAAYTIDLGGASVVGGLHLARQLILADPERVVLLLGADVPRSGLKTAGILRQLDRATLHPRWDIEAGATLAGLYGMMANRMMFESGVTEEQLRTITRRMRENGMKNPRAFYFNEPMNERALARKLVSPYSGPMMAVVTNHGFATLLTSEGKAESLRARGLMSGPAPVHMVATATAFHSEFLAEKYNFGTPASVSGSSAFATAGWNPEQIDYAWVYDCFTGMLVRQAAEFFNVSPKLAASSLENGRLDVGNKIIPVNRGGGILNAQAAMSMSAATGLTDVASQYGLYANLPGTGDPAVSRAFLNGNGGIDSVSTVALFSRKRDESYTENSKSLPAANQLRLARAEANAGEKARIFAAATVFLNPSLRNKDPYVIAAIVPDDERMVIVKIPEIRSHEEVVFDQTEVTLQEQDGVLVGLPG